MTKVMAMWRGEVPLARTGWFYGVFGMIVLVAPVLLIPRFGPMPAAYPLLFALSVAILLYAAFMAVAIWRSADNYRGKPAWRWLARGSILFIALQVAVGLAVGFKLL